MYKGGAVSKITITPNMVSSVQTELGIKEQIEFKSEVHVNRTTFKEKIYEFVKRNYGKITTNDYIKIKDFVWKNIVDGIQDPLEKIATYSVLRDAIYIRMFGYTAFLKLSMGESRSGGFNHAYECRDRKKKVQFANDTETLNCRDFAHYQGLIDRYSKTQKHRVKAIIDSSPSVRDEAVNLSTALGFMPLKRGDKPPIQKIFIQMMEDFSKYPTTISNSNKLVFDMKENIFNKKRREVKDSEAKLQAVDSYEMVFSIYFNKFTSDKDFRRHTYGGAGELVPSRKNGRRWNQTIVNTCRILLLVISAVTFIYSFYLFEENYRLLLQCSERVIQAKETFYQLFESNGDDNSTTEMPKDENIFVRVMTFLDTFSQAMSGIIKEKLMSAENDVLYQITQTITSSRAGQHVPNELDNSWASGVMNILTGRSISRANTLMITDTNRNIEDQIRNLQRFVQDYVSETAYNLDTGTLNILLAMNGISTSIVMSLCALFPHRYSLSTLGFSVSGIASQIMIANQWSVLFFTSSNLWIILDPMRYIKDFEYTMPENERKAIEDGILSANTKSFLETQRENLEARQRITNGEDGVNRRMITDMATRADKEREAAEALLSMRKRKGGKTRSNKRTNRRKTARK